MTKPMMPHQADHGESLPEIGQEFGVLTV